MSDQLQRGDIVTLKSGGPKMTVNLRSSGELWKCTWFDNKNELQEGTFHPAALLKITE